MTPTTDPLATVEVDPEHNPGWVMSPGDEMPHFDAERATPGEPLTAYVPFVWLGTTTGTKPAIIWSFLTIQA